MFPITLGKDMAEWWFFVPIKKLFLYTKNILQTRALYMASSRNQSSFEYIMQAIELVMLITLFIQYFPILGRCHV